MSRAITIPDISMLLGSMKWHRDICIEGSKSIESILNIMSTIIKNSRIIKRG